MVKFRITFFCFLLFIFMHVDAIAKTHHHIKRPVHHAKSHVHTKVQVHTKNRNESRHHLAKASSHHSPAVTDDAIEGLQIQGYADYPPKVQALITNALQLAEQNLRYQYGSANPKSGGMDCSGTLYYLLRNFNRSDIPRESDQIYVWVRNHGKMYKAKDKRIAVDFSHLQPGDLLFWSGTYPVKRAIPITHVMMYIGKTKDGEPLMFGASDGKSYKGKPILGVSVFEFKLPSLYSKSRFVGYGCIPNVNCDAQTVA